MKYRFLILSLFVTLFAHSQRSSPKLDSITNYLSENYITINNRIGNSIIENEFSLYNKITGRSRIIKQDELFEEDTNYKDSIDFYNHYFTKSVLYNLASFREEFDFSLAKCQKKISFQRSYFFKAANFTWSNFNDSANFTRVTFYDAVDFIRAKFEGTVDFYLSRFRVGADYYGSIFNEKVSFSRCKFYNETDFSFSSFQDEVRMNQVEFGAVTRFSHTVFNGNCNFRQASFDSIADFSGSIINGEIDFTAVVMPKYLDLSNVSIVKQEIDLTDVKMNNKHEVSYINLINTDLSKIRLRYDGFKLFFPNNVAYETKCNVYEGLLNTFRVNGFQDSYEKLDIEYQKFRYKNNGQYLRSYIQEHWWNYGYNKELIFLWIFRFTLILTLVNALFIKSLMQNVYLIPFINHKSVINNTEVHHFMIAYFLNLPFAFLYTVVLLLGGAFGMSFSSSQIKVPGFTGLIYIISISLLGIGCSAFLINFIFDM